MSKWKPSEDTLSHKETAHKSLIQTRARNRIIVAICLNVFLIAVIAIASISIYQRMLSVERENCWNLLSDSADSVEDQINTKIDDNINVLQLVANSMVTEDRAGNSKEDIEIISQHLSDFQKMTIFDRIDMIFPNNKVLVQNEGIRDTELNFKELYDKGAHISGRKIDISTQKECVY